MSDRATCSHAPLLPFIPTSDSGQERSVRCDGVILGRAR